jgi:hypothetical protein
VVVYRRVEMRASLMISRVAARSAALLAATAVAAVVTACASGGSGGSSNAAGGGSGSASPVSGGVRSRSTSRDVIRADEVTERAADASNAYEIIQKLRPQMLVGRGTASPNDNTGETSHPKVYVDNVLFGDLGSLRTIVANQVLEVRFISASDATTRWGTGHMGGVILITTKRR